MIKVTFIRHNCKGKHYEWHINKKHKGPFTKEFKSINELVKFLYQRPLNLSCLDLKKDLTEQEYQVLLQKFRKFIPNKNKS